VPPPGPDDRRFTVFLDRDGVINRKLPEGCYVTRWEEFEFLPGAVEALARLKADGTRLVVVTNQRGVARGAMTLGEVDEIHRRMQEVLATSGASVDAIYVCPHQEGTCDCRKPQLGLFRQAMADDPAIELAAAVLIGDSASDVRAANDLGVDAYLVGDDNRLVAILSENPTLRATGSGSSLLAIIDARRPKRDHGHR
jgi:D-glycero-D-manno-heptose 1,7-bisphosphate phosphatase